MLTQELFGLCDVIAIHDGLICNTRPKLSTETRILLVEENFRLARKHGILFHAVNGFHSLLYFAHNSSGVLSVSASLVDERERCISIP